MQDIIRDIILDFETPDVIKLLSEIDRKNYEFVLIEVNPISEDVNDGFAIQVCGAHRAEIEKIINTNTSLLNAMVHVSFFISVLRENGHPSVTHILT